MPVSRPMDTDLPAASRYSLGAIALHWIIAILIALNFAAAWTAEGASAADKAQIMANHKAFGLLILLLSISRLVWRLVHRAPPLPETLQPWEAALAKVVHWLFYGLTIALPATGWAMHSAATGGLHVGIFGLLDIPGLPMAKDRGTGGVFMEMHEVLAMLMLALFALHVAGALKHMAIDRDGTMRRILPWG